MPDLYTGVMIAATGISVLNLIITKLYGISTGKEKNFIWQNKYKELNKHQSISEFNELKRRTRIVVIDDENSFPVSIFQSEGYSIDKWDKVNDYSKLESGFYDIIVLDIKGVADHISADDGIGVLVDLKSNNPAQIIISFSQHSYDLNKVKFFQQADDNITKPSDYLRIKKTIDNLILTQFKPERYISTLNSLLSTNGVSEKEIEKINNEISKAITKKETPNWTKALGSISNKTDLLKQTISLANTILKFFQ